MKQEMSLSKRHLLVAGLIFIFSAVGCSSTASAPQPAIPLRPANPDVILATTTSTQDSGLLDVLLPEFQRKTGYKVKTIAVGSGQAMALGEKGEADVLLVHAADSEVRFMQAGHGINRKLVMHNDFIIVGPLIDPGGIRKMSSAIDAFKRLSDSNSLFVSRGDNSGTHQLELKLWKAAAIDPRGQRWYQESGQGMGATLSIVSEKDGYTVTDRATYLAMKKNLKLDILVEGDPVLLNVYHVIQVNPQKSSRINADGARAFADFMVAPDTLEMISKFGVDRFGQPLFFPDAGKTEAESGSV
jgi:tungstate transport system substrate-binding protein